MYIKRMCRAERAEGSITIFLSLTLVLIMSFLFSLLEAARVGNMKEVAKQKLALELESAFGRYSSELWTRYGLLFLDGSLGTGELNITQLEGRIMEESRRQQSEIGFFQMKLQDIEAESYRLATDEKGSAFFSQAVAAGQEAVALDVAEKIKKKVEQGGELQEKSGQLSELWDNAKKAEKRAEEEKQKEEREEEKKEERQEPEENVSKLPENPMSYAELLKKSSLLSLVIEKPEQLSRKGVTLENSVEKRNLYCGNMSQKTEGFVDKLWFLQYLNTYFHSQQDEEIENQALDYEIEYCIGGKETDMENLEQIVQKILLLREAGNFITIMQDGEKQTLAMEIAAAAVGFTGIVPLIEAVKYGILLAWSYVESILDVRCLLAGGKVAFIKKASEWRSDLFHLKESLEIGEKQENQNGMDYNNYLLVLLGLTSEEILIYRAMNVIEKNMQLHQGYENFRMDTMIDEVKAKAVYTAKGLFLNLFPQNNGWDNTYYFRAEKVISCQK